MSCGIAWPFPNETPPEFLRRHGGGRAWVRTEVVARRFGWTLGKAYRELSALAERGEVEQRDGHPADTGWSCGWRPSAEVASAVAA